MMNPYIPIHTSKRHELAEKCYNLCIKKSFHIKNNQNDSYLKQALRFNSFCLFYHPINNIKASLWR